MTALADDLRRVLADEPLGFSCDELARCVHRRRALVLAALRTDPRFEHDGRTRGSRWRLADQEGRGRNGTGTGRNDLPWPELDASGVPALVRRAENAA